MGSRRIAAVAVLVTTLLAQLTVVNRLGLPAGETNLALVVVICLGALEGPGPGMAYGFAAGLVGDLLSTHTLGRLALVWTLVGYAAGLLAAPEGRTGQRSPLLIMTTVAVGSVVATLGYASLAVLVGAPHEASANIAHRAVVVGVCDLLVAPFVFVWLRWLYTRLEGSRG